MLQKKTHYSESKKVKNSIGAFKAQPPELNICSCKDEQMSALPSRDKSANKSHTSWRCSGSETEDTQHIMLCMDGCRDLVDTRFLSIRKSNRFLLKKNLSHLKIYFFPALLFVTLKLLFFYQWAVHYYMHLFSFPKRQNSPDPLCLEVFNLSSLQKHKKMFFYGSYMNTKLDQFEEEIYYIGFRISLHCKERKKI